MFKTGRKLTAILLSLFMIMSASAPMAYATDGDPTSPPGNEQGGQGGGEQGDPEDPPHVDHVLAGTVKLLKYGQSESSAVATDKYEVVINAKDATLKPEIGSDGKFSITVPLENEKENGKYTWTVSATDETHPASGTLEAGKNETLIITERYVPSASDFEFTETGRIKNGFLEGPGDYVIKPSAQGAKLSKQLDAGSASTITVHVDETGNIEPFYVWLDDLCSKKLTGQTTKVDDGAPVIQSVTTESADPGTFVKVHGIYSKQEAKILLKTVIKESGAGLASVYLVGEKNGQTRRYDPTAVTGQQGQYTAEIGLPEGLETLDAEVIRIVAVDAFGHESEKVLIAQTEEGSSVTLEEIEPEVYGLKVAGTEYDLDNAEDMQALSKKWFTSAPSIEVKARDTLSGLSEISLLEGETVLDSETISEKEQGEKTLSATARESGSSTGSYSFTVKAKDNAGNETEKTFSFRIDSVKPVLSFSGITEGSFVKDAPTLTVNENESYSSESDNRITVTIETLKGDDPVVLTFDGTNKAVIGPENFSASDNYIVRMDAVDAAGNHADQKTVSFCKDSVDPDITLNIIGKANDRGWYKKIPKLEATAQDVLSGLESFAVYRDGETLESLDPKGSVELKTISRDASIEEESSDGSYTFEAKASDRAGNRISKDVRIKIDTVAPVVSAEGVEKDRHYRSVPTITISQKEKYYNADGAYIRYHITRDNRVDVGAGTIRGEKEATIPSHYFKEDGEYAVSINAEDAAGNESNEIILEFIKDSTAPVISLSGVTDGKYYNKPQTVTLKVIERFFKTNDVKVTATRTLGGNTATLSFPWTNKGETSLSSKTFSETGTYKITASAEDKAGNRANTKTLTFTVDTKAPEISITGVTDGAVYTYGQGVSPKVDIKDDYLDSKSIVYTKGGVPISNPSFEQIKENDGLYTLTVTATDKAGNTTRKQVSFTINRFGSYYEYNDAIRNLMGKAVQHVDENLIITEHNVSVVEKMDKKVYRDSKLVDNSAKTQHADAGTEQLYRHIFGPENFEEEGAYTINVISKDAAGNEMDSQDENGQITFYVDRTAPTITVEGIDPKGVKAETADVIIRTSDTLTGVKEVAASVDGQEQDLVQNEDGTCSFTLGKGMRQEVRVSATDGAGNEEIYETTASVSPSGASLFLNRFGKWLGIGAAGLAAVAGLIILLGKRRKKDDEEQQPEA